VTSRYRTKPQVHFEEFRILEQRRVAASNAIWAILAGSKIASNTLNLTEGSTRTLAEMFPTVEHIERFNLRSDEARGLLGDAEIDLCTMGMSYAIALHEDFVKTCLEWLLPLGLISRSKLRDAKTANVHEKLEVASGARMDADSLVLFHMTRLMRNCHIHAGGSGSSHLEAMPRSVIRVGLWLLGFGVCLAAWRADLDALVVARSRAWRIGAGKFSWIRCRWVCWSLRCRGMQSMLRSRPVVSSSGAGVGSCRRT
jgi:hypothetical protein